MLDLNKLLGAAISYNPDTGKPDSLEMITPLNIVNEMLDTLPDEVWNKNSRFLDIACKSGNFLREIYVRLLNHPRMIAEFPDNTYRKEYILNNQLYGIALTQLSQLVSTRNVYGYICDSNIHYIENWSNIVKNKDSRFLVEKIKETFGDMQFNVVVGNPPYNDKEERGGIGSGNAIYPSFMQKALDVTDKYVCMIVPSGWMLQYPMGTKHELVDKLRQDSKIVELHDFKNSQDVFAEVNIPNGVCYYLADIGNTGGITDFYIHNEADKEMLAGIRLYNDKAGVIFRDKFIISISEKIDSLYKYDKRFDEVCAGAKHHFDDGDYIMTSTWDEYSISKSDNNNIMYFLKSNNRAHRDLCTPYETEGMPSVGYGWVSKKQIPRNVDDYCKHKIIVGQAFTAGSPQVMDIPQYIGNNSVCSQSFVPIFSPHDSEEECLNICKYIKTKLFRYLVNSLKAGQNLGNRTYALVPVQDFTDSSDIDWSQSIPDIEKQLYAKYGLSQEEIDYIESTIKPMS